MAGRIMIRERGRADPARRPRCGSPRTAAGRTEPPASSVPVLARLTSRLTRFTVIDMADGAAGLQAGWAEEFHDLLAEHEGLVNEVDYDDAFQFGRNAAMAAFAPILWSARIGERWETSEVTEFLNVTRQAVYKKVRSRALLGIAGRGTTWFPTWQFDPATHQVRFVVSKILDAFHVADDQLSPLAIASWANTEQPELGETPAAWIIAERDPAEVVQAAVHTAAALAQ